MNLLQWQEYQYVADGLENDFKALLNRIVGRYPSRAALAKELHITPSRLSRALNTGDFPLNVANCLRLAKLSGDSPTTILRAAGKTDVAELIELLYGKPEYSADERELVDAWRTLSPRARTALRSLVDDLVPKGEREKKRRTA